eukprot:TRINITY_DN34532_c0_g1_i2.p1 TRINITY_DN34532_c0_g1~~TRINITY_DN34532_c0_g1_i2.p1  ORF type:complete len:427 (+),score=89.17 TRINITY_DN34532_c0_g1_i2:106-1281(+)
MNSRWEVIGGADKGGILVRQGQELSSPAAADRLSTGAEVEQLELVGDRLRYRLLTGTGPKDGWVSVRISGKDLLKKQASEAGSQVAISRPLAGGQVVGPSSGYRHRWAVNIDDWMPIGDAVMRFKFFEDRKRALVSRLLVRQASASSLNMTNFKAITIKRTKGKKPFLAEPLPPVGEAPNWNVNCSHEGSWVVCASEPHVIAGIDVAELRRTKKNGEPIDFYDVFKENLTQKEWDYVKEHGSDPDTEYEAFSRFWSAKEAFVKARGDGIAYPLGQAEFSWRPLSGFPDRSAFESGIHIEGSHSPRWRFVQHRMPGERPHWTTVGRGPLTDVIDAHGEFSQTLRRKQESFSEQEWKELLHEESPHFDVLPVGALVPQDSMGDYVKAGGRKFP